MVTIGDFTVIADAGATLVKLLREHLVPSPVLQPEYIGLGSPADSGDLSLSIFLYNVKESGEARRTRMEDDGTGHLRYPPMAVDLSYLITAHSSAEIQARATDEQRILGRTMQVLYDNAILRGASLYGTLAERGEELKLVKDNLPPDILVNLWNFNDTPYKLSLSYTVGPVFLESTRTKSAKRVLERDIRLHGG